MSASLDDILTTQQQGVVALNALNDTLSAIPGILTPLAPANGGTGVANGALETITLGGAIVTAGAFTTSGAFALILTVTGATNVTLPTSGTLAAVGNPLSQFAATTSAQLRGVLSDETGAGVAVFADTPTLTTPKFTIYTVATLPAAGTVGSTARAFVSDANATLAAGIGTAVVGGGANFVPVFVDNAATWIIG
jgi:hypothetical protein